MPERSSEASCLLRPERVQDVGPIHEVFEAAFGRPDEAELVDRLRDRARPFISWVAEREDVVLGHILFTPVRIEEGDSVSTAIGLAPLSVRPDHQREGIGIALCRRGLEACREAGERVAFVLGHPGYYPRFGFQPAWEAGLYYERPGPNPAFMVAELVPGALAGLRGRVRYHEAFEG